MIPEVSWAKGFSLNKNWASGYYSNWLQIKYPAAFQSNPGVFVITNFSIFEKSYKRPRYNTSLNQWGNSSSNNMAGAWLPKVIFPQQKFHKIFSVHKTISIFRANIVYLVIEHLHILPCLSVSVFSPRVRYLYFKKETRSAIATRSCTPVSRLRTVTVSFKEGSS